MRVAQVAPLYESVPPHLYGGTERIVAYLTEELVRQGHEVTLFASADSRTSARLVACCPRSLRLGRVCENPLAPHCLMLEQVFARAHEFDLIHFHTDWLHFPLARRQSTPTVTTMHGRQDLPELGWMYREFSELPLISISRSQRAPVPWANWVATVYHGLPPELYRPRFESGGYLAFTGRMSCEKRPDLAIRIAREAGIPLLMAAKVDPADREYFERVVRPLLHGPGVEYLGEIDDRRKEEFLGRAIALLFPIQWPEPFGLVMIESMACGTPVIAFGCGSVPEVVDDGVTGFIVEDVPGAVRAAHRAAGLDRRMVRHRFERRFTARRMAEDYLGVYQRRARGLALARGGRHDGALVDGRDHRS